MKNILSDFLKAKSNTFKQKSEKKLSICSLPQDLIVEITANLASCSSQPLSDMKNLRAVCKTFRDATEAKKVGKSMCIYNEWSKFWNDKQGWRIYLTFCANSGNFQAQFILGMDHMYANERLLGMNYLMQACMQGHLTSAYILAIHSFLDPETQAYAIKLFNRVSCGNFLQDNADYYSNNQNKVSGNMYIHNCRKEAKEVLRHLTYTRNSTMQKVQCENPTCGLIVRGCDLWVPKDELPRRFCSEYCRWTDEYFIFNSNH